MRGTMTEEVEGHGAEPEVEVVAPEGVDNEGGEQSTDNSRTPSDIEDLAQEMGWVPQEKYRGDPSKWKDAKSFVKSTVDVNRSLSKDVRELKDTQERLLRVQSRVIDDQVERKVKEATARFHQAVADGDSQGAFEASEEIRHARIVAEPETNPVSDWQSRNQWYGSHPEASDLAYGVCERLAKQGLTPAQQLAEAEKTVRKAFPDLFEGPKPKAERNAPPPVQGGQRSAQGQPRAKGWGDLPPNVRSAAERNLTKWGLTKETYAKAYFEENA